MTATDRPGTEPASRRRHLRLAAVVVVLVVGALLLLTGRGPGEPAGPTGRSVVEGVLATEPTAPVVLPVAVPAGYVLAGGDTASGSEGEVPVAAWVFRPSQEESGLAVVQVCVAAPARCTATPDGALPREAGGREVSVVPFGPEAGVAQALDVWRDVVLTTDWQSLDWIDRPLDGSRLGPG